MFLHIFKSIYYNTQNIFVNLKNNTIAVLMTDICVYACDYLNNLPTTTNINTLTPIKQIIV